MKQHIRLLSIMAFMASFSAQANWNDPAPWDNTNWPQWTPMYWMDEMSDRMNCCDQPWQDGNWSNWPGAPWNNANTRHYPAPQPYYPYSYFPPHTPDKGYPPIHGYAPNGSAPLYGMPPNHPQMAPQPMPQMTPAPRWN